MNDDPITEKIIEGSTYRMKTVRVAGNTWQFLHVSGRFNYVSVCKKTNNPFGGKIGKDFKSFDEAVANYKHPDLKVELLKFELGLTSL